MFNELHSASGGSFPIPMIPPSGIKDKNDLTAKVSYPGCPALPGMNSKPRNYLCQRKIN